MPQFPNTNSASGIWTLKRHKQLIQGSNWPTAELQQLLLPIATRTTNNDILVIVNLSGTIQGTVTLPARALVQSGYYRYDIYLFIFNDTTTYYRVNLTNYTYTTGTLNSKYLNGTFTPISNTLLLGVNPTNNTYRLFDMSTQTEYTTTEYIAATADGIATTHTTLGFFDRTTTGIANSQDVVWWTAANNNSSPFYGEYNWATISNRQPTSVTLSTRNNSPYTLNFSRNYSQTINKDYGLIWLFDSQLRLITRATNSFSTITPQDLSYNGNNYVYIAPHFLYTSAWGGGNSAGKMYGVWRASSGGNYFYEVCHYDPLASSTPAPTRLFTIPAGLVYNHYACEGYVTQINQAGHVAIIWNDTSVSRNTYKLAIYNGTTQVGSTITITLSTQYQPNDTAFQYESKRNPGVNSYLGPILT